MLLSYLPLLRGWGWRSLNVTTAFTISAGRERKMWEARYPGWFWSAYCSMQNPLGEMVMGYYDASGTWKEDSLTPYGLHSAGFIDPNPTGTWCSRYDAINSVYAVAYASYVPLPIQEKYKLSIKAPSAANLTVNNYAHLITEILNPEEFNASLREVFGGARIIELLKKQITVEVLKKPEIKPVPSIEKIVKEVTKEGES